MDRLEPAHQWLPEFAQARRAVGFPELGPGSSNVVFQDVTYRYTAEPAYLFCCSIRPDFSRCQQHGEGIVRIKNLRTLAGLLRSARPDLLGAWRAQPVGYEKRSVNPFREGLLKIDPFRKSQDLKFENELRICWEASEPGTPSYLDLASPMAVAGFERMA